MIDSKTEQRLRVSMKSTTDLARRASNTSRLQLPSNQVGLYGSLKGFHSLDCLLPFDHGEVDPQRNNEPARGSSLLCRSKQKNWSEQRSPNEQDWEDASLLMVENQQIGPSSKNCVRCLLT
jgi:hypothetical protein